MVASLVRAVVIQPPLLEAFRRERQLAFALLASTTNRLHVLRRVYLAKHMPILVPGQKCDLLRGQLLDGCEGVF